MTAPISLPTLLKSARSWALLTVLLSSSISCWWPSLEGPQQSVHYSLVWDLVEGDPGGGPVLFRWTSELGLELEIEELFLSNYTVQLMPCLDPEEETGEVDSVGSAEQAATVVRLGVGVAHAGHGDLLGPAAIREPIAEHVRRSPTLLEPIWAPAGTFCQVHYLVARQPTPPSLPEWTGAQTSLYVRGVVSGDSRLESEPFEVHSKLAHGKLVDLPSPVGWESGAPAAGPAPAIHVTVERSLKGMFASLTVDDFRTGRLERQLLRNLMNATTIQVELHDS